MRKKQMRTLLAVQWLGAAADVVAAVNNLFDALHNVSLGSGHLADCACDRLHQHCHRRKQLMRRERRMLGLSYDSISALPCIYLIKTLEFLAMHHQAVSLVMLSSKLVSKKHYTIKKHLACRTWSSSLEVLCL